MAENANVVTLPVGVPREGLPSEDVPAAVEHLAFCVEQMNKSLEHMTAALVSFESRIRRLELAAAKAENDKLKATAVYNGSGARVR